ncbi:MAG: hypothetical protein GY810_24425 [Aureispira sp.]|nr:hypothetical protein [Aureispira sp.]
MTKSEKRYFKLFCTNSNKRGDKYLELFDYLDKQKKVDVKAYKKQLSRIKNLSAVQTYLYELILQSLELQQTQKNSDTYLLDGIKQVELLFERGLILEAKELVLALEKYAQEREKWLMLPLVNYWWFRIENINLRYKDISRTDFEQKKENGKKEMAALHESLTWWQFFSDFVFTIQNSVARNQKEFIQTWMSLLKKYEVYEWKSLGAKLAWLQLRAILESYKRDKPMAKKYWMEIVTEVQTASPQLRKEYKRFVNPSLFSAINNTTSVDGIDSLTMLIEQLEKIMNEEKEYRMKAGVIVLKHQLFIKQERFAMARDFALAQDLEWTTVAPHLKLSFYKNIALNFWAMQDFNNALVYVDKVLEEMEESIHSLQGLAMLLKAILYYEKGEMLLLPHMLQAIKRQLRKENILFKFEQLLLSFLLKLVNLSKPEHLDAFRAFRLTYLAFVDTLEEREEREFLAFFNYEGWLDSHVNKTPFQKVFPNF